MCLRSRAENAYALCLPLQDRRQHENRRRTTQQPRFRSGKTNSGETDLGLCGRARWRICDGPVRFFLGDVGGTGGGFLGVLESPVGSLWGYLRDRWGLRGDVGGPGGVFVGMSEVPVGASWGCRRAR